MAELSLLLVVVLGVYIVRLVASMDRQKRESEALRNELARLGRFVDGQDRRIASLAAQARSQEMDDVVREASAAPPVNVTPPPLHVTPPLMHEAEPYAFPPQQLRQPEIPRPPPPQPPPAAVAGEPPVRSAVPGAVPEASAARSFEEHVGANWLNRIGIALLVFGMAFFLAYQFTHMGAAGKVVTGLLLAGAVLGGGLWLERKPAYAMFGRAAIGGGWALLFFTLFAMHFVGATRVLQSELLDLLLLFVAGVGMVAHSLRYRSQVVTSLAFLLAFSTVTISHQTLYSLLGSAVLALGA